MPTFFTVGPTQLHPLTRGFIQDALDQNLLSISHRSQQFQQLYSDTQLQLRRLLNIPDSHHIFFLSSATEAMERLIQNCVHRTSFHYLNGAFSRHFYTISQHLARSPQFHKVQPGQGYHPLDAPIPPETDLLCLTHNETSTGVTIPLSDIYTLKQAHPNHLLALDIVSSVPIFPLDFRYLDAVFFSIQKGFCLPAGLGILIVNQPCLDRSRYLSQIQSTGSYHSFASLSEKNLRHQTPTTPNILAIYLLGKICQHYNQISQSRIYRQTLTKANQLYQFFNQHPDYSPFVTDPHFRSPTSIVINTPTGSAPIISRLADHGFIVSPGYKQFAHTSIRIANYPSHSLSQVKRLISLF